MIKRERDKKKLWVQVFGGDEAFQGNARKKISDRKIFTAGIHSTQRCEAMHSASVLSLENPDVAAFKKHPAISFN